MQKEKFLDPFFTFLPALFLILFVISSLLWAIFTRSTGILVILKSLLPLVRITTLVSGTGLIVCITTLLVKHTFLSYFMSIPPTLYLHENLKIHTKISDFKNEPQPLTYVQRIYNSCVLNSYFWLGKKDIAVIITMPKNGDAQDLLRKKVETLRKDLIYRFPDYSFGGKFEQVGSFMVLQGNHN